MSFTIASSEQWLDRMSQKIDLKEKHHLSSKDGLIKTGKGSRFLTEKRTVEAFKKVEKHLFRAKKWR